LLFPQLAGRRWPRSHARSRKVCLQPVQGTRMDCGRGCIRAGDVGTDTAVIIGTRQGVLGSDRPVHAPDLQLLVAALRTTLLRLFLGPDLATRSAKDRSQRLGGLIEAEFEVLLAGLDSCRPERVIRRKNPSFLGFCSSTPTTFKFNLGEAGTGGFCMIDSGRDESIDTLDLVPICD
jgi:hypothetical protein